MTRNRAKVLIADDHKLIAELCKRLLETEFNVVATVNDGHSLIRAALTLEPQVLVVDIGMPLLNGLDAGQQIKRLMPAVKLVFLTMHSGTELAAEAFRRGASGYLLKTCAAEELVGAVRKALQGLSSVSPSISKERLGFLVRQGRPLLEQGDGLTERQREVLQLLAEGKSMKEAAHVLSVATRTVAFHKYRMMETLGVKSNAELVRYAIANHVVGAHRFAA